jgi:hypothetical protein
MEWLITPLDGFNGIASQVASGCETTWAQCTCGGGLLVCEVQGALKVVRQQAG